jgi:L-ornithine N5-oxygenase
MQRRSLRRSLDIGGVSWLFVQCLRNPNAEFSSEVYNYVESYFFKRQLRLLAYLVSFRPVEYPCFKFYQGAGHTMASHEQSTEPVPVFEPATSDTDLYDLVCIGFGAAQLATAIANQEAHKPCKVLFLERKPSFSWHPGKHLARTRMKNPFVYDLATIRNPRSAFSYANYLLARKRLVEFANSDRLCPLRDEFRDYLQWCAAHFKSDVRYASEVVEVIPATQARTVTAWKLAVRGQDGSSYNVRARNIAAPSPVIQGLSKPLPMPTVDFLAGQRIIAMDDYLSRRNELRGLHDPPLNVALVGSSHQTAEILDDLLCCPQLGNVTVVTEDSTLAPLQVLCEQEPPPARLCSIWAKPSCDQKLSITDASELVQSIYMRAYEKHVASRGEFVLRVVMGREAAGACAKSDFIIRDTSKILPHSKLLQSLEKLALGCRSQGDSLEEVQFKRGAVAAGRRVFLMSAHSEGGRSLAKDIAMAAGTVVKTVVSTEPDERRDGLVVQARI